MKEETRDLSIGEALDLGHVFAEKGKHESAITMFRGVLMHEPDNFEAIERLGTSLFELKLYHEALFWFWRGLKLGKKSPIAQTNYGLCLSQLELAEEGLPHLQRAAHLSEGTSSRVKALAYNNLGNTLERLGRHREALDALEKGLPHNPDDPFPHYNRGVVLIRLNRHREALESLTKAITLSKGADADAQYNRGMARLSLGDLGGFEDYEARLLTSENRVPNLGFPADKKWNGEELGDKPLLVISEQGLGDTIQFLRFIPLLAERVKNITLVVQTPLYEMAKASFPNIDVKPGRTEVVHDDIGAWVPLMSLPLRLGIKDEIQIPKPWWFPITTASVEDWEAKLFKGTGRLRVGVCWSGNFQHKNDAHRSIDLNKFAAIFDAPADFVSLQQMRPGETQEFAKLKEKHPNLSALYLTDFRDTAAVMCNLDLVITVDTSVAHLAGSLGVWTWALIPAYSTDWRWQLERPDCPWYPSVELYRQPRVGDWASVLRRIVRDLTTDAQREAA